MRTATLVLPALLLAGLLLPLPAASAADGAHVAVDTVQDPAPWDLDRLDQRLAGLDSAYSYAATGADVTAYVIDTGIRASHREFEGRVRPGFSAIHDGRGTDDCDGHGTHVAGTIAGATYGVAKRVTLVPVRVLGCSGSGDVADLIAGINWVTAHHKGPSVANVSLGVEPSAAVDRAVARSVAAGVSYVVAAGNDHRDACSSSPGRVASTITVGASTMSDERAAFSNLGPCVDVFAPGSLITSASNESDTATAVRNGTSMAAPHVTGVVATYLQRRPAATPAVVRRAVIESATTGILSRVGTRSPNRLLSSTWVDAVKA